MTKKALTLTAAVVAFSLLLTLAAFILRGFLRFGDDSHDVSVGVTYPTVILDAGHGGEDGGTSSAGGILEKDVNLDVAKKLCDLLTLSGYTVVLTREDDRLLYKEDIRDKRKAQDLRTRVEVAEAHPDAIFVSIHQNSFPIEKYSGLQVYYSPNDADSEKLARSVRDVVRTYLQPENTREIKRADSKIYLLDRIKNPAIMVECGFLSNVAEAERLGDEGYRMQLASVIYKAICEFVM